MRIKKGFTLAEILIVLSVIGIIATMTIPNLVKGIDETTYKASFKKGFSIVSNIAGILKADDNLPTASDKAAMATFFHAMMENLAVQEIVPIKNHGINASTPYTASSNYAYVTYGGIASGDESVKTTANAGNIEAAVGTFSPWIVTDDSLAYTLTALNSSKCGTKAAINTASSNANAKTQTCLLVIVDTNGLAKLPNTIEVQSANGFSGANVGTSFLNGDRYYIYVGRDGVAKGNKAYTLSGRLLADIK